ncbi:Stromal interaction molecule [Fasciola gigantica]|uniref:Stromal interaction molecule n=1 Tax=Fasciola gigantica TaxID=46835 RepID=A0A504YQV4_FASGI|nr:Stromal interaction molecule [Fasciola gigantica]
MHFTASNWTAKQTIRWLVDCVDLPQYESIFLRYSITGKALPLLAMSNGSFLTDVLMIRNPIHKKKIMVKALDTILFGPPRRPSLLTTEASLVTASFSLMMVAVLGFSHWVYCTFYKNNLDDHESSYSSTENALKDFQSRLDDLERLQFALNDCDQDAPNAASLNTANKQEDPNLVITFTPSMGPRNSVVSKVLRCRKQQAQISQAPITGLFDKIIGQIKRHVAAISARLRSTTDPMIRLLLHLIDAVRLVRTNRDARVAIKVISSMVQSSLEHYRPGCWRNQPHGLETMEHLKEGHMPTLRHMISFNQTPFGYARVTCQVTQTWIRLDSGSLNGNFSSRTPSGNMTTDLKAKDGVSTEKSEMKESTTNEANGDQAASIWSGGWELQTDGAAFVEATSSEQSRLSSIKWNWGAFTELLKVHVVYLSQVDAYLAKEVSTGHPGAISFVIDLLDQFVFLYPSGTTVGASTAAAAANYFRSAPPVMINGTQTTAPTGPNSSSTTTSGSVSTISPSTKREFTVLNEYNLWSTLEAMRIRVSTLNAAMFANSVAGNRIIATSLTDSLALRLLLAYARVRCAQPPIGALYTGCSQAREFDDSPTLHEKVKLLTRNRVKIYQSPKQRDANTIDALSAELVQIGVSANMDNLIRFLCLAAIFVVERALKQLKLQDQRQQHALQMPPVGSGLSVTRVAAYIELDACTRLISIAIIRGCVQTEQPNFKVFLLNNVLGITAGMLFQEHELRNLVLSTLLERGMPPADLVEVASVDPQASLEDPTGYCMEAGSRLPEPMQRELDVYLASRALVKLLSELVTSFGGQTMSYHRPLHHSVLIILSNKHGINRLWPLMTRQYLRARSCPTRKVPKNQLVMKVSLRRVVRNPRSLMPENVKLEVQRLSGTPEVRGLLHLVELKHQPSTHPNLFLSDENQIVPEEPIPDTDSSVLGCFDTGNEEKSSLWWSSYSESARNLSEWDAQRNSRTSVGGLDPVNDKNELALWLQLTYELEMQHYGTRKAEAETRLNSIRQACKRLYRKRYTILGSVRLIHSDGLDDLERRLVQAKIGLEQLQNEIRERHLRWTRIETLLGLKLRNDFGVPRTQQLLNSAIGNIHTFAAEQSVMDHGPEFNSAEARIPDGEQIQPNAQLMLKEVERLPSRTPSGKGQIPRNYSFVRPFAALWRKKVGSRLLTSSQTSH